MRNKPIFEFLLKHLNTLLGIFFKSAKLIKSLKLLSVLVSVLSMTLFSVCESFILGLAMAIALMGLILVHELGHVIVLQRKGYGFKLPLFIPFLGAVIFAPKFRSRKVEAEVGIGGPLIGTIAAMACAVPYLFNGHPFWLSVAIMGVAINMFNMIPISPFEGGRITQAADYRLRYVGYALLLAFTVAIAEPGMILLWILVVSDMDRFSKLYKVRLTYVLFGTMTVLTLCHVGKAYWGNVVDCGVAGLIAFMGWLAVFIDTHSFVEGHRLPVFDSFKYRVLKSQKGSSTDKRRQLKGRARYLWFIAWLGLLVAQAILLFGQFHILAKH